MRHTHWLPGVSLSLLLASGLAQAQSVVLSGMLGNKALLVVDGGAPKTVAPGETYKGVKVVATRSDAADLEFAGKRHTLRVGDTPVQMAGNAASAAPAWCSRPTARATSSAKARSTALLRSSWSIPAPRWSP